MRYAGTILLALILPTGCNDHDTPAPAAELTDIHGDPVATSSGDQQVTATIFITTDCPIANAYAPEIRSIVEEYTARGVAFILAHVDPATTNELAIRHQAEYELPSPIVLDHGHRLAREAGITVTPEVCVRRGDSGDVLYRGRIDNLFPALGSRRQQATRHELRDALEAVLAGQDVEVPSAEAVGCRLPTPR